MLFAVMSLLLAMPTVPAAEVQCLFGLAIEGMPSTAKLNALVRTTKVHPRLIMFYLQWPSRPERTGFPEQALQAIQAEGAIPVMSWEPMFLDAEKREHAISAESIIAGEYDLYLAEFARRSRQFAKPFLIRFAHEMNLARYHWGGGQQEFGPESPKRYKAMFRHVVSVFRAEGASNARWVFCPNVDSVPAEAWNSIACYYPGDDFVDVAGLDGYNWGTTQTRAANGWDSQWSSFASIFVAPLKELRRIAPGKPVAVFETSSATEGGNKEEWVLDMLDAAKSFGLAAVIWFEANKEIDWRLETGVSETVLSVIDQQPRSPDSRLLDR